MNDTKRQKPKHPIKNQVTIFSLKKKYPENRPTKLKKHPIPASHRIGFIALLCFIAAMVRTAFPTAPSKAKVSMVAPKSTHDKNSSRKKILTPQKRGNVNKKRTPLWVGGGCREHA